MRPNLALTLTVLGTIGCEHRDAFTPPQATATSTATAPATTIPATQQVKDWRHGTGICALHHRQMNTVIVHGLSGTIQFVPGYYDAKEKLFPNCGIQYWPELYSNEMGMIYVCPDCEAARLAWRE